MKYDKFFLRKKFLLLRKEIYLKRKKFNFSLIFKLIKKNFKNKKITIGGYYPSNYEVNILNFLKKASKKKFKVVLPFVKSSKNMSFKLWTSGEPLCVNEFGIPEPNSSRIEIMPDIVLVPLVAFDKKLNRIGYGKGYYDRSLKKIKKNKRKTIFLGIAFSGQECHYIPINKYDYKLDYIFTEQGIINAE